MATIKSFTSLEQSRKLAEMLPLESADMYYPWYIEEDRDHIKSGHRISIPSVGNFIHIHKVNKMILPCWSLAALLDVLPEYHLSSPNPLDSMYCCRVKDIETYANNQVDACVDMILKLHELNLL